MSDNNLIEQEYQKYINVEQIEVEQDKTSINNKKKLVSLKFITDFEPYFKKNIGLKEKFFLSQNENLPISLQRKILDTRNSNVIRVAVENPKLEPQLIDNLVKELVEEELVETNEKKQGKNFELLLNITRFKKLTKYSISKVLLLENLFLNMNILKYSQLEKEFRFRISDLTNKLKK